MEKLKMLGIEHLAQKSANQVSGGEKQRVAIARALINDPDIIMGDEPTGNLNKKNTEVVFDIFKRLAEEFNQTLLIVTHDQSFAEKTHRIINMEDGKIVSQSSSRRSSFISTYLFIRKDNSKLLQLLRELIPIKILNLVTILAGLNKQNTV